MKKFLFLLISLSFLSQELFAQAAGRIYKDDCYSGSSQLMYSGNYKKNQLTFGNDKISSVNMYTNSKYIRLYEHDNFIGEYRDIYFDQNDLHTIGFEDETSSIRVLNNYYQQPTANEPVISANVISAHSINNVTSKNFWLPKSAVNNADRIHMQGLGQNGSKDRIVLSGCVASGPTSGCTGRSYLFLFDNNGNFIDMLSPNRYNGISSGESHPSSTQMIGDVFPNAVAEETGSSGPSSIEFYTIENDVVEVVPNSQQIIVSDHIGTLAYANINGYTYLIGGTWNSARLYIWRAYGENRTSGFNLVTNNHNPNNSIVSLASIDENWGAYNSFWLGKMDEDGRTVLFATHGPIGVRSYADIWEVRYLGSSYNLGLRKIHNKWKDRWTTNRPYFLEGTMPVHRPNNTPQILAFPDDFKTFWTFPYLRSTLFTLEYEMKSCGSSSSNFVQEDVSDELQNDKSQADLNSNVSLAIAPNPVSGSEVNVSVEGVGNNQKSIYLQILDMRGQVLRELKIDNPNKRETRVIDVSSLDAGSYIVHLLQEGNILDSEMLLKVNR